jgi:hypothetical protein
MRRRATSWRSSNILRSLARSIPPERRRPTAPIGGSYRPRLATAPPGRRRPRVACSRSPFIYCRQPFNGRQTSRMPTHPRDSMERPTFAGLGGRRVVGSPEKPRGGGLTAPSARR